MSGLAVLLAEHGEAVEADLLFRGVDLGGLWTGDLSWRRLRTLIDHLPTESATKTAVRESLTDDELTLLSSGDDVKHGPWSRQEHLLAGINDIIGDLVYVTLAIATDPKSGRKPQPPARWPRPGIKPATKQNPAALQYLLDIQRRRDEYVAGLNLVEDGD